MTSAQPAARTSFGALVQGYEQALARLMPAIEGKDEAAAQRALFETLHWAVTIDDWLGEHWLPAGKKLGTKWRAWWNEAASMQGVRAARNRVHHDWAIAVRVDSGGRGYPRRYPVRYFELVWRDLSDLPSPDQPRPGQDRAYQQHLEGKPSEVALNELAKVFQKLLPILQPPKPQRPAAGSN